MWSKITSLTNPRIRAVCRLREKAGRAKPGHAIAEGLRELTAAAEGNWKGREIYLCPEWFDRQLAEELADRLQVPQECRWEVSPVVYQKIAYGDRRDGLLGVIEVDLPRLSTLADRQVDLLVVVEGVEKPGNLGAIFRSADAVGVDAVIVVDAPCDPWNHNVIRASLGTVFTVPFCVACARETITWLAERGLQVVAADPHAAQTFWEVNFVQPSAIVLGAEHTGLSPAWETASIVRASIPMRGKADSLNVSVAGALFLYEALRQRLREKSARE